MMQMCESKRTTARERKMQHRNNKRNTEREREREGKRKREREREREIIGRERERNGWETLNFASTIEGHVEELFF
jgi:ribosome-binding protein aMBF1 (putative translation factor)